jgi:hypothetical protein
MLERALEDLDFSPSCMNAFSITWANKKFYAFPPFGIIANVLKMIGEEKETGVCVLPDWLTQPWFPKALYMMVKPPVKLKPSKMLPTLPMQPTQRKPPPSQKLTLIVCLLSGGN